MISFLNISYFHDSLQAKKIKDQLKNKKISGTDRASFREAFAEIREQRNTDVQEILNEVKIKS